MLNDVCQRYVLVEEIDVHDQFFVFLDHVNGFKVEESRVIEHADETGLCENDKTACFLCQVNYCGLVRPDKLRSNQSLTWVTVLSVNLLKIYSRRVVKVNQCS